MPAGKEQHVPLDGPRSAYHAGGPDTNLFRGFPSRTTIAEQLPVRALGVDFTGAAALVISVIPFQQVAINLGNAPEASEFACPGRAHQRTGEYLGESQAAQPLLKTAGVALATLGQRQIGESSMLARQAPGSLAMSCQVNNGQRLAHDVVLLATISYGPLYSYLRWRYGETSLPATGTPHSLPSSSFRSLISRAPPTAAYLLSPGSDL